MRPTESRWPSTGWRSLWTGWAVLFALLIVVVARTPGESAAVTTDGLWVATADGLFQRDVSDGQLITAVPGTKGARLVAVDAERGRVWAVNDFGREQRLRAFDSGGSLIVEVDLDQPSRAPSAVLDIAVETETGAIAVAFTKSVRRYGPDGSFLNVWNAPSRLVEIEYDPVEDTTWVLRRTSAVPLSAGVSGTTARFPSGFTAADLATDTLDGSLWLLATAGRLIRLAPDGTFLGGIDTGRLRSIAADATGAWVATTREHRIVHYDRSLSPTATVPKVAALLVPDGSDGTLFHAAGSRLTHEGDPAFRVSTGRTVREFALLRAAATPPVVGAGDDADITLPAEADLDGSVTPAGGTPAWTKESGPGTVTFGDAAALDTTAAFSEEGVYVLRLTVTAGALSGFDEVTITVHPEDGLPPDPAIVASEITETAATDLKTATSFLYTGADPIQTGVDPDDIDRGAAAVVRGIVLDVEGDPLPGVTVTVNGHPEYGQTLTRADGMFDLAVNGGGYLTAVFAKDGYLTAHRTVQTFVQQYAFTDEVVLVELDPVATTVDLTEPGTKVGRGSSVTDGDGTRQPAILFFEGTTATVTPPGGSPAPISSLTIRVTEYTVGDRGPSAMPAALPAASAYTYAVEVSADETDLDDRIDFNQPVIYFVENFLEWPVGWPVPTGSYDRTRAVWVPEASGLVVKVISETSGKADLDLDGDGTAEDQTALDDLGVTAEEQEQLADLYEPGQELWRVPLSHFTTLDMNGAVSDEDDIPEQDATAVDDINSEQCTICPGSRIEFENQVLGETVGLTGVPFALHYDSGRMPGQQRKVDIDLTGATVPPGTQMIQVDIYIAGQHHRRLYPVPGPQLSDVFTWDGLDGYGRRVYGEQEFTVRMDTIYGSIYQQTAVFGTPGIAVVNAPVMRGGGHILKTFRGKLDAGWDRGGSAVGGWSPSVHHVYDPEGRVLYFGTGERQSDADDLARVMRDIAGGGSVPSRLANNTPVGDLDLNGNAAPVSITSDAEGGYYYFTDLVLVHVNRFGLATAVAGRGANLSGPGPTVNIDGTRHMALGYDGKIYIGGLQRVQVYDPATGLVEHIAGNGGCDYGVTDPEGPALTRELCGLTLVAPAPDGSVYIAEESTTSTFDIWHAPRVIWRLGTDGIMRHVIPVSSCPMPSPIWSNGFCQFDVPASQTAFMNLNWLRVAPDGVLYIGAARAIARITHGGIIEYVGGRGVYGTGNEDWQGKPFVDVNELYYPDFAPNGDMFLRSSFQRLAAVDRSGTVRHVAARVFGPYSAAEDGASAQIVGLGNSIAYGFAFSPEGEVIYGLDGRIRSVVPRVRGYGDFTDITIASRDGSEVYRFDGVGRHLQTLHALTGATIWSFGYDGAGRLVTVTDAFGNVTTIGRNGSGAPKSITGPYGDVTALTTDANGYLETVTNPASETVTLDHDANGLLQSLTTPRGFTYVYGFDSLGKLESDADPAGGSQTFTGGNLGSNATRENGWTVGRETALGRTSSAVVEIYNDGSRIHTTTSADGLDTVTNFDDNGSIGASGPDGVTSLFSEKPDPRFSIQSPLPGNLTVTNPGGLTLTSTQSRTAVLFDPDQLFSIDTITDIVNLNGRVLTNVYDGASKTSTTTTPELRTSSVTIDAFGRVVSTAVPDLAGSAFIYDTRGRIETVTVGTGVDARTTTFTYNARGFIETVTDPLGRTVAYEYDAAGRVTKQTLPGAREVTLTYDANGNVLTITPPGKPAHSFTYTAIDQVASATAPDVGGNETTNYGYDLDHELDTETRPDGLVTGLDYDSAGRLATITFSRGTIELTYNATTGQIDAITGPDGITVEYTYLGALQTGEEWLGPVAGSVGWTYDNNFRAVTQTVNGGNAVTYTYDDDDILTGAGALVLVPSAANGLIEGATLDTIDETWTHNDFAEVSRYTSEDASTTFYDVTYTHDKLGRITQRVEKILGTATTYDYVYDAAGRLRQVDTDSVTTAVYSYDLNGNRLTGPASEAATHDAQDRLLTYDGTTYTYDDAGDLESREEAGGDTWTYTYDEFGNLTQVILPDATEVSYLIDPVGRRIGRKVGGVLQQGWIYDGDLAAVAEFNGAGALVSRFVYATRVNVPDYVVQGGRTYRVITDHLGSLRLVVDAADGTVVQQMNHDEYGRVTVDVVESGSGFTRIPFGYAGGLYDPLTGLVRFGARDYDAESGRWTTKDPAGFEASLNAYEYAVGDPISMVDFDGLTPVPYHEAEIKAAQQRAQDALNAARNRAEQAPAAKGPKPRGQMPKRKGWVKDIGKGKGAFPTLSQPVRPTVAAPCPPAGSARGLRLLAPLAKRALVVVGVGFFVKDTYQHGVGTALYNATIVLPMIDDLKDRFQNPPGALSQPDTPPPNRW